MKYATLIPFFVLLSLNSAFAQGNGTHGGSVVVCKTAEGEETELAEFREVRIVPALAARVQIHYSTDDVSTQIETAIQRLDSVDAEVGRTVRSYVSRIRGIAHPIENYDWGFSNDVNRYPIQDGCQLKTAVYYFDDDTVDYRTDLVTRKLKERLTDQAGLWVHEGVFQLQRESSNILVTLPTRRIVSVLFAKTFDRELLSSLVLKYLKHRDETTRLFEISDTAATLRIGLVDRKPIGLTSYWIEDQDGTKQKLNRVDDRATVRAAVGQEIQVLAGSNPGTNNQDYPWKAESSILVEEQSPSDPTSTRSKVFTGVRTQVDFKKSWIYPVLRLWIISDQARLFENAR